MSKCISLRRRLVFCMKPSCSVLSFLRRGCCKLLLYRDTLVAMTRYPSPSGLLPYYNLISEFVLIASALVYRICINLVGLRSLCIFRRSSTGFVTSGNKGTRTISLSTCMCTFQPRRQPDATVERSYCYQCYHWKGSCLMRRLMQALSSSAKDSSLFGACHIPIPGLGTTSAASLCTLTASVSNLSRNP